MAALELQLGHPKIRGIAVPVYSRLADVFPELFREREESIYVYWRDIPLRLRYGQDLGRNFDDILAMTWLVSNRDSGANTAYLANDLVTLDLELRWRAEQMDMQGCFIAKHRAFDAYARALNARGHITLAVSEFLGEWNLLLQQVLVSFEAAGIHIKDGTERRKLELLQRTTAAIPEIGSLYRKVQGQ